MENQQHLNRDLAPSFSIYSCDTSSITSKAVAKVIREEHLARLHENDYEEDPFEFSLLSINEEETDSRGWNVFNLEKDDEIDTSSVISVVALGKKLFIDETGSSSSSNSSSSEADESDGSSPPRVTKCKKSSSTGSGSGSKRWIFRYLLRRSNSEGKQPKKADSLKHKRNIGGRLKVEIPVHEQFYVERRADNESGKRRSYLPYRKDLVGLVGIGKMLPF